MNPKTPEASARRLAVMIQPIVAAAILTSRSAAGAYVLLRLATQYMRSQLQAHGSPDEQRVLEGETDRILEQIEQSVAAEGTAPPQPRSDTN